MRKPASISNVLIGLLLCMACLTFPPANSAWALSSRYTPDPLLAAIGESVREIVSVPSESLFAHHYTWQAVENNDVTSANEDGTLSEWEPYWYIAHDWSDYGAIISTLNPGDLITVNGIDIFILGRSEWEKNVYTDWDVYDVVGWDKAVFQTCLGDDELWIAYGVVVDPPQI